MTHIAIVQGASGGLGRQLVTNLLKRTPYHVVATCRDPEKNRPARSALPEEHQKRLTTLRLDVTDESSVAEAAGTIADRFGERSARLLINASGILHAEKSLREMDAERAMEMYRVNALGPALVFKHMLPLLAENKRLKKDGEEKKEEAKAGRLKGEEEGSTRFENTILASLSARVGSIEDNRIGGWYNYRASKSALNQLHKTMAVNLASKGFISVVLHPGTVETDFSRPHLGGTDKNTIFSPEKSAGLLVEVLERLTEKDNGKFLNYAGKTLPW